MDRTGYIFYHKILTLNDKYTKLWVEYTDRNFSTHQEFEEYQRNFYENISDRDIGYLKFLYECFYGNKIHACEHWIDKIQGYYTGWLIRNCKTGEPEFGLSILLPENKEHSYTGYPLIRVIPKGKSYTGDERKDVEKLHVLQNFLVPTDFFKEHFKKLSTDAQLKIMVEYGDVLNVAFGL